jgi:hypothetical protein
MITRLAIKKILFIIIAVLAIQTGLYPSIYFFIDRRFGLLQTKSEAILTNFLWNIQFYIHIIFGGLAPLIGWTQFNLRRRTIQLRLHKKLEKYI